MNNLVNFLKQSDIFYQFTPTQLELVANLCQEVVFNTGEIIFEENSSNKELYVIAQGEVNILINRGADGNSEKKRGRSGVAPKRSIFWRNGIGGRRITFSLGAGSTTQKDTRLIMMQRDKLIILCETYPQLGYRLMHNLAADLAIKIRNTDLRIREQLLYNPQQTVN